MLIPNHPDDERLSALASRDDDATSDAALTSHVSTCVRCTETLTELGALRASLAELPDLAPSRPLRLLPPVADAPAAGSGGGWIRRLFAPAMTAGAALAMVGVIGTAGPALQGMAASRGQDSALEAAGGEGPASSVAQVLGSSGGEQEPETDAGAPAAQESPESSDGQGRPVARESAGASSDEFAFGGEDDGRTALPAERSPWPMVLFTGVALMVGAALLRWILVPRAG